MAESIGAEIREQLRHRREKLGKAIESFPENDELRRLLGEVDSALHRLDTGTYGLCETCNDPIETERLLANPLLCFCLDHLTPPQQRALEEDLELASRLQTSLLPARELRCGDWEVAYHYQGAGPTSGDYCDVLETKDGTLYFMIGDVRGKGFAAAMAMAHVHATFRALVALDLPLVKIVERASRTFCESTLPTFFATLVCGKAAPGGDVEICNAGHVPPLLLQQDRRRWIESTGLPLGMFCDNRFTSSPLKLSAGDTLILYTDGVTEARNRDGDEYGQERLLAFGRESGSLPTAEAVSALVNDLQSFCSGRPGTDDVTIMAVRRLS